MEQAERIKDVNALVRGLVWVLLTYDDGSEFCFQTTLNQDILRKHRIILEEGCFVRLDKKYFVKGQMVFRQFQYTTCSVSLWTAEHYTNLECEALKDFM